MTPIEAARQAIELRKLATQGEWHQCGADRGGCQCCSVSVADHPVAETTHGDWGDDYPAIKIEDGGDGLAGTSATVKAVMEQITYGHVPLESAKANAAFIAHAANTYAAVAEALIEAQKTITRLLDEHCPLEDPS